MNIQKVRGTQDLLDLRWYNFIIQIITKNVSCHNFAPIQLPILENEILYTHALGQSSDVVNKEMFTVQTQGESKMCLRPEGTAGTIRAFIENQAELTTPWKVYTCGPMFRYERPQKGRWRQFDQFNLELIQTKSMLHDIEFLVMLDTIFTQELKLDYLLKINYLGNNEELNNFTQYFAGFLQAHLDELCQLCQQRSQHNALRALDCKNPACQSIFPQARRLSDFWQAESKQTWQTIQEHLTLHNVNYHIAPELVRGLDYYRGMVFEFTSPLLGSQSTFAAGGRYCFNLPGATEINAIGAGIGVGRLELLCRENTRLSLPEPAQLIVFLPLDAEQESVTLQWANRLREKGFKIEILPADMSLKSRMKKANAWQAQRAVFMGSQETALGKAKVRNLITGEEHMLNWQELLAQLNG